MRTVVLSQYYEPEPIPKPAEVAEGLRERGHDVAVITGLPNYPSGSLYPGYRLRLWTRERIREIPLLRVFEVPYHGLSAVGRIGNYASFMASAVVGGVFLGRAEVIYVFYPPLTVGVAAAVLSALKRVPFVLDVQDIWPDAVIASGLMHEGFLTKVMGRFERFVYQRASRILVVTDGALENLVSKGVPRDKILVFPNWISGDPVSGPSAQAIRAARAELSPAGEFVVTYAGNLGALQDIGTVLEAAELLKADPTPISIRIIGNGSQRSRLEGVARSKKLDNISFLGPYPAAMMPAYFAASDALVVHLNAGQLNDLILPTKTVAYMAAARPIIAATGGATAQLIDRTGAGLSTLGGDPVALAAAIRQMAAFSESERQLMGERARAAALAEFDRGRLIDRLASVLADAALGTVSRREPGSS